MIGLDVGSSWPLIITALGGVVTSMLATYLLHRRILADRETKHWRNGQQLNQQALVRVLEQKITDLEKALLSEVKKPKADT